MTKSLHAPWAVICGVAIVLLTMVGFLLAGTYIQPEANPSLVDPDNYMRLLRTEILWNGGGWFNNLIPYTNIPHGEILHWSRPMDLLIIAASLPFMLFTQSHEALFWGGVLISPILMIASLVIVSWGTRAYVSNAGFVLICALMAAQPMVRNYTFFGRADHHALLLILFTALFFATLHIIGNEKSRPAALYGLGVLAAAGLWVSVEALVGTFVICLSFGTLWLISHPGAARDMSRYLIGVFGGVAFFIAIDHSPANWFLAEYDRFSVVHLVLFGFFALSWIAISALEKRTPMGLTSKLIAGTIGVVVPGAALIAIFPEFLAGPYAGVPAEVMDKWFSRISEVDPLWPSTLKKAGTLAINLGPVVAATYWIWRQIKTTKPDPRIRHRAILFGIALLTFCVLALLQIRWATYAQVLLPIPWGLLLLSTMTWTGGIARKDGTKIPLRSLVFLGVLTSHVIVATGFIAAAQSRDPLPANSTNKAEESRCRDAAVAQWLHAKSVAIGRPINVMTFVHDGPEFVWRTRGLVHIVASPYHRNSQAILAALNFWSATDSDNEFASARAIYQTRRVDYVVFCTQSSEAKAGRAYTGDTLFKGLDKGAPPPWLTEILLSGADGGNIRVFAGKGTQ